MKILVTLSGSGGELDRAEIEVPTDHDDFFDEAVDLAVQEIIEGWHLSIGDTIIITEVQ